MANTGENAVPRVPMKNASIHNGHDMQSAIDDLQKVEPGESDITEFIDIAQQLEKELTAIVIGQALVVRELLLALLAGGHGLFEGGPWLGKTLLGRPPSDALPLKFCGIQFTPVLIPAHIVGTTTDSEPSEG